MSKDPPSIELFDQSLLEPEGRMGSRSSLQAQGEPTVWLMGGAVVISILLMVGLFALLIYQGGVAYWGSESVRDPKLSQSLVPAILGTVTVTLLMTLVGVPFGVMTALYLNEYATPGPTLTLVRIAITNLAVVPSIVYGVFGLVFFCYAVGGSLDDWLYGNPSTPVFGKPGLLWAALTLALFTLPVVIVATESALDSVPRSMREASHACGATQWQTLRRIVIPRAMPGILTGALLAMARGATAAAPLMMVGAFQQASPNAVDGHFPFLHLSRGFSHLGSEVYFAGSQHTPQSPVTPMLYVMALLLVLVSALLHVVAVWLRSRLRKRRHESTLPD